MEATVLNCIATESYPRLTLIEYSYEAGIGGGIGFPEFLELPIMGASEWSMSGPRKQQATTYNGGGYIIELKSFSISCLSTNYNISLFNKSGAYASLNDSIYEILNYTGINKAHSDNDLGYMAIANRDDTMTNKLYLHLINYAEGETGPIYISLNYFILQNRLQS